MQQLKQAKWHFAKDVQRDFLGDNQYDTSYLTSEVKELGQEVKKRSWSGIKDETGDVAFCAQMLAHQKTGLNFPLIGADGSIKKFQDRRAVWNQIFKDHGSQFHTDYLKGGSNYARPEKVQRALGMAGVTISDEHARQVSAHHATVKQAADHHNVYAVLLSKRVIKDRPHLINRLNPNRRSSKPAVYVGSTGLPPTLRFHNHKHGHKGNSFVKKYGLKLLPHLYEHYNPTTFHKAEEIERFLAGKLRDSGYTVLGGNEKTSADIFSTEGLSRHGLDVDHYSPAVKMQELAPRVMELQWKETQRGYRESSIRDSIIKQLRGSNWQTTPDIQRMMDSLRDPSIIPDLKQRELQSRLTDELFDAQRRAINPRLNGEAYVGSGSVWLNRDSSIPRRALLAHEAWHAKNPRIPAMSWGSQQITPQVNLGASETLARYYEGLRHTKGENPVLAHLRGFGTAAKYQASRLTDSRYYPQHTVASIPTRLTSPLPKQVNASPSIDLKQTAATAGNSLASNGKSIGRGALAGIPIAMALDKAAPTVMSNSEQQEQFPVTSYLNDVAGHMLDSTKAITGGAAAGAAVSGGVGAIPGAVAGGIGDLVHKGWNAARDVYDIGKNLGGTLQGNARISQMQNRLSSGLSHTSTSIPTSSSTGSSPPGGKFTN